MNDTEALDWIEANLPLPRRIKTGKLKGGIVMSVKIAEYNWVDVEGKDLRECIEKAMKYGKS